MGAQCGAWTTHSLKETSAVVMSLPFHGSPAQGMGIDYSVSLYNPSPAHLVVVPL